ncbi:MAG: FHA domain-containing protein [Planctomycetaceae bacterium]|nr:FHA domain-containing protein [Planctomycetaceae bacterium]
MSPPNRHLPIVTLASPAPVFQEHRTPHMHGVIQLLDSANGRPLQNWRVGTDKRTTIGRALENDIVVADPYVSRSHAYIEFDRERQQWLMTSVSQQQLVYDSKTVAQLPLADGMVIRLGGQGCHIRFNQQQAVEQLDNRQTISFDMLMKPKLSLDKQQLAKEVDDIASGDFFQNLKQAVQRQRQRQTGPDQ